MDLGSCNAKKDCDLEQPDLNHLERVYRLYLVRGPLQQPMISVQFLQQMKHEYPSFNTLLNDAIDRQISSHSDNTHLSEMSASELRTYIYEQLRRLDWSKLPPAAQLIWMERQADMLWHADMYTSAFWIYHFMILRPLPEQMARRIEIKAQAARHPQSPVSQQVRIWLTTTHPMDRVVIAQQYSHAPIIAYLDWIAAFHERDMARLWNAWYHLWLSIAEYDPASRVTPRAWRELFRTLGYL
jgi:hypothetical protein